MSKIMYRQGDVLLCKATQADLENAKRVGGGQVILALGEVTGHHHSMTGEVAEFATEEGRRLVWVEAPTPLVHQEHAAIEIQSGVYWIVRQREYTPEAIRNVAD